METPGLGGILNPAVPRPAAFSPVKTTVASDDEGDVHHPSSAAPWQRMKWTDDMVRLLVSVVSSVADDPPLDARRPASVAALQKKGKWKAVSRAMLDRGCCVSPQQCEDKFNDLNKRYKKLNDLLGSAAAAACHVVENPALLDSLPHLPPKAREDARKILASRHLFYREMCAYHSGQRIPDSLDAAPPAAEPDAGAAEEDEEEADFEDEGDENASRDDSGFTNADLGASNRAALRAEIDAVLQDGTMPPEEMREWFARRAAQLEEERVGLEAEALELERRRFKWQRFCRNKDREMERMRLDNERLALENRRMALEVRQREIELELELRGQCSTLVMGGCARP